ncbi:hypothetical protein D3C72_1468000 [compost metagenome]
MLLQLGVVVTKADDQLGVADQLLVRIHPVTGDVLQGRDVVAVTVGRRQQVGVARLQPDHGDVAVRIEEARQQGAAVQIDHLGVAAHSPAGGVQRAHGDDDAVTHGHGLGGRHGVVDGQDGAAGEDCRRRHPRGLGHAAASQQGGAGQGTRAGQQAATAGRGKDQSHEGLAQLNSWRSDWRRRRTRRAGRPRST